jgi:hypothetical protein
MAGELGPWETPPAWAFGSIHGDVSILELGFSFNGE